jgi:hypothetical protein
VDEIKTVPASHAASKDRLLLIVENLDAVCSEVVSYLVFGVDG